MKKGDIIKFGKYPQSQSLNRDEIEWLVLSVEEQNCFIISKFALDCKAYNDYEEEFITWEYSSLRSWLNDSFFSEAFELEEKKRINTVVVKADENPWFNTNPGRDTLDKLFLISILEADRFFPSDKDRQCIPSTYAISNGIRIGQGGKACGWWLRSPGYDSSFVAFVRSSGAIRDLGGDAYYKKMGVRPACWIKA